MIVLSRPRESSSVGPHARASEVLGCHRFEPPAFSSLFDNPQNILKFMPHVPFLYTQDHFGQAFYAGGVLFLRCGL